jgi:hypothetical protein
MTVNRSHSNRWTGNIACARDMIKHKSVIMNIRREWEDLDINATAIIIIIIIIMFLIRNNLSTQSGFNRRRAGLCVGLL